MKAEAPNGGKSVEYLWPLVSSYALHCFHKIPLGRRTWTYRFSAEILEGFLQKIKRETAEGESVSVSVGQCRSSLGQRSVNFRVLNKWINIDYMTCDMRKH